MSVSSPVVGIEPAQRKRKTLGDRTDSFHHQTLFTHRQGRAFGPAAVNVGQREGMDEVAALLHSAAVLNQVAFEIAGRRIAPVSEGPHRHTLSDGRAGAPTPPARTSGRFALRAQQTVDGCGADLEQPASHHRVELEMAVPFHCLDQNRDENSQPLAADAISRLPQHRQRLMHRLVVESLPLARFCWR